METFLCQFIRFDIKVVIKYKKWKEYRKIEETVIEIKIKCNGTDFEIY